MSNTTTLAGYELLIINGKSNRFKINTGLSPQSTVSELRKIISDRIGESDPKNIRMIVGGKEINPEKDS
jgi:hypothetical protein